MTWIQKLVRWMTLGVMVGGLAWGQSTGQNVVNQTVQPITTLTSTATYTSQPVQNIGQTNHIGTVNVTSNAAVVGGNNCVCVIQGSTNGTVWTNLGLSTVIFFNGNNVNGFTFYGYGAAPYIRVVATIGTSDSITFSITYTGQSIASNTVVDALGYNQGMQLINLGALVPGAVTTLMLSGSSNQRLFLYGLEIFSNAAGTNLDILCLNSGIQMSFSNLGVTRTLLMPPGFRPLLGCAINEPIAYRNTGGVVNLVAHYRAE